MSFYWSFWTSGTSLVARLECWPIEPGSLVITAQDGLNDKELTDNGDGTLSGDGSGTINYDYGFIGIDFTTPLPVSGTEIKATYDSVEGGCADNCGRCATHYLKLDVTPGTISGSDEFTIADAWSRLFTKIERDIKPIHVEIIYDTFSEEYVLSIGYRFDHIPADEETLDDSGLHLVWDDTSW